VVGYFAFVGGAVDGLFNELVPSFCGIGHSREAS
jgi:hypothetical protein